MDSRKIQCHGCKLMRGKNLIINCLKKECQLPFCLFCYEEKYGIGSYSTFLKEQLNHKWKCFKCRNVCKCKECLNQMNINNSKEYNLLNKKRFRFSKNFHKRIKSIEKNKKNKNQNVEIDFPNIKRNEIINKLVIRSAILIHLIKIYKLKKFSNKPCLVCNKFKCPKYIEILKFKSVEEVKQFLDNFYFEFEEEIKKGIIDEKISKKIYEQKKNLDKIKDILNKIPFGERLKVPKRICSNCLSSLLIEQNGLFMFSNLLKEEDEAAKLTIKQKLEIINGLYNLILKEANKKKTNNSSLCSLLKNLIKDNNINGVNIFNSILNNSKIYEPLKPENKYQQTYFGNNNNLFNNDFFKFQGKENINNISNININLIRDFGIRENYLSSNPCDNDLDIFPNNFVYNNNKNYVNNNNYNNIYYLLLNKISFNVSEANNLLNVIQKKLYEYMINKNNGIYNELILINELLKLKSDSIRTNLLDYNRELQNLNHYCSINPQ